VMQGSVLMAAIGIAIGLAIAASLGAFVEPLLFDLAPRDPMVFTGVAVVLLTVAVIASLPPARRAQSIRATDALRHL
jgi:putative ABC transport system permease protein